MALLPNMINIALHLDLYIGQWIRQYGWWIYGVVFLIIFCECGVILTPILPGESLLFALGALAARGELNLTVLLILLVTAAILGGIFNYTLGYKLGSKLFPEGKKSIFSNYLERTHIFYQKHGGATIFLARFIPIIRTYAPFVAGVASMQTARFMLFNIISALIWIPLFLVGSYYFGNLPLVKANFPVVIVMIMVISVIPIIVELIRGRCRA